jgi:hypothetical protein
MGMPPFKRSSYSTYDKPRTFGDIRGTYADTRGTFAETQPVQPEGDPNPVKYEVIKSELISSCKGVALIVFINYPDCKNYEGNKILLYEDTTLYDLYEQGSIDPHFSDNKDFRSPIARFEPTDRGWDMAKEMAEILTLC